MKSLLADNHRLADADYQIDIIEKAEVDSFEAHLEPLGFLPLKPVAYDILQVNLGKMCNQTCAHCHVDAGPDRKEIMGKETMRSCLEFIDKSKIKIVDLTGGAPEMNPHFRWFVEELSARNVHIIVRCNLTIILANPNYHDLPNFYRQHKVELVSSLPHFSRIRTDAQRGTGVFEKSIQALSMLNSVGYGQEGSGLELNLVFNPSGAFLPPDQASLERDFKDKLLQKHNVVFNKLFTITNMPISRFLDYLINTGNYEDYMTELVSSFNPAAVEGLMCRNTLSVGWDGQIYDCDFNQMLEMPCEGSTHITDIKLDSFIDRNIRVGKHCFGCTAGAGSSCGGAIA